MEGALFQLIIVGVGAVALVRGFRQGVVRQAGSLLAAVLAIVAARVLLPGVEEWLQGVWTRPDRMPGSAYIYGSVATALVFLPLWGIFETLCSLLTPLLKVIPKGVLNQIAGAVAALGRWMLVMSVLFNLWGAAYPDGALIEATSHDDGNLAACVMLFSPALAGAPDYDLLLHEQQLDRARYISSAIYCDNPKTKIYAQNTRPAC